jgi:hypothetical protein
VGNRWEAGGKRHRRTKSGGREWEAQRQPKLLTDHTLCRASEQSYPQTDLNYWACTRPRRTLARRAKAVDRASAPPSFSIASRLLRRREQPAEILDDVTLPDRVGDHLAVSVWLVLDELVLDVSQHQPVRGLSSCISGLRCVKVNISRRLRIEQTRASPSGDRRLSSSDSRRPLSRKQHRAKRLGRAQLVLQARQHRDAAVRIGAG